MHIVGVSDVTLGFGSSQILEFMKYLSGYYKSTKTTIIEPDQTDIFTTGKLFGSIDIHRIATYVHVYSRAGRMEYIIKASKTIDKLKPDVLVIFTTFCLPVLYNISHRPKYVIYYSLESISAYWDIDIEMNAHINSKVDLIIFPEENRAAKFFELCGVSGIPVCMVYNCTNSDDINHIIPIKERNGRIIHQGRLKEDTGLEFFLQEKIQSLPIDLYGIIESQDKDREAIMERLTALVNNMRYKGSVVHSALSEIRKYYSYSIVFWNPTSENTLYACPNKFFESIADGIPPVSSPHPQCKLLIKRYKCGLLMGDWSFSSYYETLKEALDIYGTQRYDEMVENCKKAVIKELNWSKQMEKVRKYLKSV